MELTIILPVKNIENEITSILRTLASQCAGISVELIVADMGSADKTVWEAVQLLRELGVPGFVMQNGDIPVPAALNTALNRAGGEYVSFAFARRLYRGFLPGYLQTAEATGADFVFGCDPVCGHPSQEVVPGERCVAEILRGSLGVDIAAVLVRNSFLRAARLRFYDECSHGYAEEFVLRCLLAAKAVARSPALMERDAVFELRRGKQRNVGMAIFQRVEAVRRVADIVATDHHENQELLNLFWQDKLPRTVLGCVDVLLREGVGRSAIRAQMRADGHRRCLSTGRLTPPALKREVLCWRAAPWAYKGGNK